MAKSKSKSAKASAVSVAPAPAKVLNGVKGGRVTKPSQFDKAKSKGITKSAPVKKELEKKIRHPSPSDSEDADSGDSSDDTSDESASDVDSDENSDDSSASESKEKKELAKASINGANKDDDSDSSSESDEEEPAPKSNGVALAAATAGKDLGSSGSDSDSSNSDDDKIADAGKFQPDSDASDDDEDDSSDSDENEKTESVATPKVNGTHKKLEAADDDSEADSEKSDESSGSDENESEDEEEAKPAPKKRKADVTAESVAKKTRIETNAGESENGATKTLFIGRLSWNVDDDSLFQEFREFGEIVSCKVMYHKDSGKSKGFGYVEFSTAEDATAAKEAKHESIVDGRPINVDFATPFQGNNRRDPKDAYQQRSRKFGDVESAPSQTLFVGNLSFDATYDMIKEAFEQHGTIERISLPTSKEDGSPKGFGYVSFSTTEEATEAINNLRGSEIAGRPVRLDYATPRPEGDGNGGGFRGGRGGNRGGGSRGGGRGGFGFGRGGGGRGGRGGAPRGGRGGGSTNRGGFGDFTGKKISF